MAIKLVVPMRWASPGFWLPMAAETVAPMPMVSPMAMEIWKKPTTPCEADGRRDGLLAEAGDVEEVEEIDGEDGDEADGAGERHDGDVAHDRARQEACRRGAGAPGGGLCSDGHLGLVLVGRLKCGRPRLIDYAPSSSQTSLGRRREVTGTRS